MSAADHAAPKKSASALIWGIVGVFIASILGVIVLLWIASSTFPMVFSGLNGTLDAMVSGFTSSGIKLGMLSISVGTFMSGGMMLFFKILCYALLFALAALGIKSVLSKMKGGGGGNHH